RNRIISGLCRSVVVVEAPEKSGALITAEFALDQGRDVFVHSCSLNIKKGLGCRKLSVSGAGVINSAEEIISLREAV
ncbi:MAG: DNA-processing protein DprA, partial [Spirochaetales bacterium]|nr:DNA-processing protein DprA [Spirochaetales bacterium]